MFVRAYKKKGKLEAVYERDDGSMVIRRGGTPAWRYNNPGNMKNYPFSHRHGAINGKRETFAIFPDYQTGRDALAALIRSPDHRSTSIGEFLKAYAPKEDRNDPVRYRKLVRKFTGLDVERKMGSLDDDEREALIKGIERIEGSKPGQVIELPAPPKKKISAVRKNKKGTIVQYHVETIGWVSKSRAIALASSGEIDAVVATSRDGNPFLRTRAHSGEPRLEDLGS